MKLDEVFSRKTYRPRLKTSGPEVPRKVTIDGHFAQHQLGAPQAVTDTRALEDYLAAFIVDSETKPPDQGCATIGHVLKNTMHTMLHRAERESFVNGWWYRFLQRGADRTLQSYNPSKNGSDTILVKMH